MMSGVAWVDTLGGFVRGHMENMCGTCFWARVAAAEMGMRCLIKSTVSWTWRYGPIHICLVNHFRGKSGRRCVIVCG